MDGIERARIAVDAPKSAASRDAEHTQKNVFTSLHYNKIKNKYNKIRNNLQKIQSQIRRLELSLDEYGCVRKNLAEFG